MKSRYTNIWFFLLASISLSAQDYYKTDSIVKTYSKSIKDPEKLAALINDDFNESIQKARAIYTWIALNIDYDTGLSGSRTKKASYTYTTQEEKLQIEKRIQEDLARQAIKSKKAVCYGYANLFKTLCNLTSMECEVINGTAKTRLIDIGQHPGDINHAWNAVKIDNEWKLIDATWGAGYLDVTTGKFIKEYTSMYFCADPELFFLKHYPEDLEWMLIKKTPDDFAKLPLYYRTYFNSKVDLVEPREGIIRIPENNSIEIVLRKSKNENVIFNFSNNRISTKIEPKTKNDLCYYTIQAGSGSYLTVYVNFEAFVSFKLERN